LVFHTTLPMYIDDARSNTNQVTWCCGLKHTSVCVYCHIVQYHMSLQQSAQHILLSRVYVLGSTAVCISAAGQAAVGAVRGSGDTETGV
jgi:hypothetical protein